MARDRDLAFEDWIAEARTVPILDAAIERGARLRGGREKVGACPGCGGRDRFGVNVARSVFHCRGSGKGGDVIALVQYLDHVDFLGACERLTGRPPPRGESTIDHAELARRAEERAMKRAEQERKSNFFRERDRQQLYRMWKVGQPIAATPVEAYLAIRGVSLPDGAEIRYLPDARLYGAGEQKSKVLHIGPAMMAMIIGPDRRFSGVHLTWIDLNDPEGKARILDPVTGDLAPVKKVRGSQIGGHIKILRCEKPSSLIMGEGIEEVGTVVRALGANGCDLSTTAAWATINLGNLGGHAVDTVVHPTKKIPDKLGRLRPWNVPSETPDVSTPSIPMPDSVTDLVLLGDGDSDRFLTEMALRRAARRYTRLGRTIRSVWSPDGKDWNRFLREAVA